MAKLNLQDFYSDKPKLKYACAKRAMAISKEAPASLYPDLNFFVKLLDGGNNIIKWTAIQIIGNLSRVDGKNKIDKLLPELFAQFHSDKMITASTAILALSQIALNKPKYRDEILNELLKVEKARFINKGEPSPECRNVAIGHLLDMLIPFRDELKTRKDLQAFIRRQTKNTRPAVQKRAEKLLRERIRNKEGE